jgi:hypothetical protein
MKMRWCTYLRPLVRFNFLGIFEVECLVTVFAILAGLATLTSLAALAATGLATLSRKKTTTSGI